MLIIIRIGIGCNPAERGINFRVLQVVSGIADCRFAHIQIALFLFIFGRGNDIFAVKQFVAFVILERLFILCLGGIQRCLKSNRVKFRKKIAFLEHFSGTGVEFDQLSVHAKRKIDLFFRLDNTGKHAVATVAVFFQCVKTDRQYFGFRPGNMFCFSASRKKSRQKNCSRQQHDFLKTHFLIPPQELSSASV